MVINISHLAIHPKLECEWRIQAPPGKRVQIHFDVIALSEEKNEGLHHKLWKIRKLWSWIELYNFLVTRVGEFSQLYNSQTEIYIVFLFRYVSRDGHPVLRFNRIFRFQSYFRLNWETPDRELKNDFLCTKINQSSRNIFCRTEIEIGQGYNSTTQICKTLYNSTLQFSNSYNTSDADGRLHGVLYCIISD